MHGKIGKFRLLVSNILPRISAIADRPVASGIQRMWGDDFDWPAWIFDGTSLEVGTSLPRRVRLDDDLVILGNFLDHVGPERLLSSLTGRHNLRQLPRALDRIRCAPDAESAIAFIARFLEVDNYIIRFQVDHSDDHFGVHVQVHKDLGIIGEFIETITATYLLHLVKLFEPAAYAWSAVEEAELFLRGGTPSWHRVLVEAGECQVHPSSSSTQVKVPAQWSRTTSGNYDPVEWRCQLDWLDACAAARSTAQSRSQLKAALRAIIESEHRLPRLKEIAQIEGISDRTMARRIAAQGITFQQVADEVRAEISVAMLNDGTRSVSTIARALGFSHSSSFARAFRDWHGCSPGQWRAQRHLQRQAG